jgi:hypothetical protein
VTSGDATEVFEPTEHAFDRLRLFPGSAFVPYVGRPIEDVLCVQEDRVVGADNCVSWYPRSLQIPPQRHRHQHVRATVRVHQYRDGRLATFDGPRYLVRFDPKGRTDDVVSQVA